MQKHLIPIIGSIKTHYTPKLLIALSSYPREINCVKTMSYVPPHLRNPTNTTAVLVNGTGDYCDTKQLNNSSGRVNSTLGNDINGHSWNPGNRTSGSYISPRIVVVPDPVFPQWMPSERVICLKPEQVRLLLSHVFLDSNFWSLRQTTNANAPNYSS